MKILRHKIIIKWKLTKVCVRLFYTNSMVQILYMAPTLLFNNGASFKMILMDRHKSTGNKIISSSKIFIGENNPYKIAPFHNMYNHLKSDHQWKIWFRTQVLPWPVQCTKLHISSALRSLNHHQPTIFKSHSSKREANEKKCAALWIFVRMPPFRVPSNGIVELPSNLRAITVILRKHGKGI